MQEALGANQTLAESFERSGGKAERLRCALTGYSAVRDLQRREAIVLTVQSRVDDLRHILVCPHES
jgi:Ser/Thr protein kinase RdoA (MazF antagonist)